MQHVICSEQLHPLNKYSEWNVQYTPQDVVKWKYKVAENRNTQVKYNYHNTVLNFSTVNE